MKVKELKELLADVPDDCEVRVQDMNFGGPTETEVSVGCFKSVPYQKVFLLPGDTQQHLD